MGHFSCHCHNDLWVNDVFTGAGANIYSQTTPMKVNKIAFIGLGKLGMPTAVSLARFCPVTGFDVNPLLMSHISYPHREVGPDGTGDFKQWLAESKIKFAASIPEAVQGADLIFAAIQTPHLREFEGTVELPKHRADFDYQYIKACASVLATCVRPNQILVVISTVLPGTLRREILPIIGGKCHLVYNPFFIAMGTVMHDFLYPEFVLLGGEDSLALNIVANFYSEYYDALRPLRSGSPRILSMSLESAELTKVAYNTYISSKIAFANTLMEICHKTGADVDRVTHALGCATDRLISTKYLSAGMGDGGGCHPRDNIAMSFLARKLDLSYDLFEALMLARQEQARWLVDLMCEHRLPKAVFGLSFKPETSITTGSPALLCAELLNQRGINCACFDPYLPDFDPEDMLDDPHVILIGTKHLWFADKASTIFPLDSVVIDPHRYIPDVKGVRVIRVGQLCSATPSATS